LSQIFLTDERTFIETLSILFIAVSYTTAIQIVGRQLDQNSITRKYPDEMFPHFARDVRQHLVLTLFSSTRNIAFGSVSRTFAMTSIASSFAIQTRGAKLPTLANCT
jgi:hypothetical protein